MVWYIVMLYCIVLYGIVQYYVIMLLSYCLKNDINLMSSDIICITQTRMTQADDITVNLEQFEIVYHFESKIVTRRQKSMGM